MSALLAPDPAVPQRDALLDARRMGDLLGRRLAGAPARRCERVNAKYRVGDSLRVAYRLEAGGATLTVAGRTFPGRSERVYERAAEAAIDAGQAPAVLHAPELETVFWTFPNDRRLTALRQLADGSLDGLSGHCGVRARLVAYAPERAATLRCHAGGRVVAYVKLHWDAAERELARTSTASTEIGDDDAHLRVPRVLASSLRDGALVLEPLRGEPLDRVADRASALEPLGAALARLHDVAPPPRRFDRVDPGRLDQATEVVGRARPDCREASGRLRERLARREAGGRGAAVHVHGDTNLRNALLDGDRVALVDFEDAAAGPAAADLGFVLAGLLAAGVQGRPAGGDATATALLRGYARLATPPDADELRWHTAASVLARIAVPAVGRVRPAALASLRALLTEAEALLR
jgi:aminoglycoside phosphotransferase